MLAWVYISAVHSFSVDLERMVFPWCADSVAIPIFGLTMLALVALPLLVLVGWAITWLFGALPAPLTQWDRTPPVRSWIVSLIFGAAMAGTAAVLVESLTSSTSTVVPALVVALYLLASTRAALLSPPRPTDAVDSAAS